MDLVILIKDSETSKNKHILYLDINKLYGCAMRQYLPISNFKWVKNIDKIKQKLMGTKNNNSTGYILEADLEYPKKIHDIHNDYPLAPEKINIPKELLSNYCLTIARSIILLLGQLKN